MITVQININGNCIMARSATRTEEPVALGKATYLVDDGSEIRHDPYDGAVALAHKLLDTIKEQGVKSKPKGILKPKYCSICGKKEKDCLDDFGCGNFGRI